LKRKRKTYEPVDETKAVVTVGNGRGFVVEAAPWQWGRVVITAAHCLPFLPPAHGAAYDSERWYEALLGPLGAAPTIWAECYFVDPVADLAILGSVDNQQMPGQADTYEQLVEAAVSLRIADVSMDRAAWLLGLDGQWFRCAVQHSGGPLWVSDANEDILGGMSGSPIVQDGAAVGLVSVSSGGAAGGHRRGGPNPRLVHALPGRMFKKP